VKILITGICGFVGSSLAHALLDRHSAHQIIGIDNFSRPGSPLNREPLQKRGVKLIHGDLRTPSDLEAVPTIDWIIDAAANLFAYLAELDASGATRHLAIGAGKDGLIYVVDRDAMGKFDPAANHAYQVIAGALGGGVFSSPAYFNGAVYYGAYGAPLQRFVLSAARLGATPSSRTSVTFGYPGTTPSISANGSSGAIVWAVENGSPAVLHAYDANDLTRELYNSNQNASRDSLGPGNKFITPTVAAGKVFVGTTNSVAVFSLLH